MDAMSYGSDDEIDEVEDMFAESDGRWRSRSTSSNSAIVGNDYDGSRTSYTQTTQAHSAYPRPTGAPGSQFPSQQQRPVHTAYHYSTTSSAAQHHFTSSYNPYNSNESQQLSASAFATTDPFYLAQVMASHRPPASFFTHTSGPPLTVAGASDPRFPFASAPASGASS